MRHCGTRHVQGGPPVGIAQHGGQQSRIALQQHVHHVGGTSRGTRGMQGRIAVLVGHFGGYANMKLCLTRLHQGLHDRGRRAVPKSQMQRRTRLHNRSGVAKEIVRRVRVIVSIVGH